MSRPSMKDFRAAVERLCAESPLGIGAFEIADALGVERTRAPMDLVYRRLNDMTRRGELTHPEKDVWRGTGRGKPRRGASIPYMWRAVRSADRGFTAGQIAMLCDLHRNTAVKYLLWLETAGLVRRIGIGPDGHTIHWQTTEAAKEQRATPYPPVGWDRRSKGEEQ